MIKKIYKTIRYQYYYFLNFLTFRRNHVYIDSTYSINGKIYISNKGSITIGSDFRANSGKKFNPIGGDTILRLICKENAKIEIGSNCGISNSTIVAINSVKIGNNTLIGGGCRIWDNDFHSMNATVRISGKDKNINSKPIIIEDDAFIGGGSIILKGVTIGKKSIIAAGSVVTKSIPSNEVWGGNPAKFIKKTPTETPLQ